MQSKSTPVMEMGVDSVNLVLIQTFYIDFFFKLTEYVTTQS